MLNFGIRFLICNLFICLFICTIIILKRILNKYLSARIEYNMWLILLILLAVPFLPTSFLDLWQIVFQTILTSASPTLNTDLQKPIFFNQGSTLNHMNDFAVSVTTKTPSYANTLLFLLWIIGIFAMVFLAFRSWNRLHIIEKSALPLQNPKVKELYKKCLRELQINRTIPVYSTAFLKSPVTAGFIRPRIYIPIHLISDLDETDLRFMLLHELQHYRHKDILVGHFINLANILYWFHPLVWYAIKEMRCDREIACDSAVLQMLPETDYEAYGNTLINFAEKISLSPFPLAMGMGSNIKQMKRRILNIAGFQKETIFRKIRGTTIFVFITVVLLSLSPVLSIYASEQKEYHFNDSRKRITYTNLSQIFGKYKGCFVLYDTSSDSWKIYNRKKALERVPPNSTYKIYDALFGLESGIITANHSHMIWNGENYPFEAWETDQDLNSAMHNSVNWYFQSIDSQAGLDSVRTFLRKIGYGNQITGTDVNLYWTDFSLKISPIEQIELLQKFHDNDFGFQSQNINAVKNAICLASTPDGSFYGKTGTGRVNGQDVNGWFIGYIEKSDNVYYFATNIQGKSETTGSKATEITTSILSQLQIWP